MTPWDTLLSTALVGTERRPLPEGLGDDVAAMLGAPLPPSAPEQTVLAAAGVIAACRRAGWAPPRHAGPAPEPAPDDPRPLASPTAVQLLELLLAGQITVPGGPAALIGEWLERCAASGRRPPDRLFPPLLRTATVDRTRRRVVAAAGGPRLRWLADRNPEWGWVGGLATDGGAVDADAETVWTTADRDTRLRLLAELRISRPDQARALVESTWAGENGRDRAVIVAALAIGLGPADEAFLEAALDDRGKGVRQEAAQLLAALPSSRLAGRMADRLRPLVAYEGRLRRRLEVRLPEEPDQAARRDGIVDAGAPKGVGPRAWWLSQIVAATPLTSWTEHLSLDPATVVRLADSAELRHGLSVAVQRQRAADWVVALLDHQADPALIALLPPADAGTALDRVLRRTADQHVAALLAATAGPWSLPVSRTALARLRATTMPSPLLHAAPTLVSRLHPDAVGDVENWVHDGRDAREPALRRGLLHALSIRRTIAQEFA